MTEELYEKITKNYRKKPALVKLLKVFNILCTVVGFVAYPVLVAMLCFNSNMGVVFYIVIPALAFVILSLFRKKLNAPRPYEALNIDPLIVKTKKGSSFPSRHVFSIFVIAGCWFGVNIYVAFAIVLCGIILAYIRVVGGIHFPKDVFAGTIIGLCSGLIATILYLLIKI